MTGRLRLPLQSSVGPSGRHFSFLVLLLCSSGPVMWSPAHNRSSVCGSVVAREAFGQEASANGWQPLHIAWLYLMRCPRAPQPSDKLPSPHWHVGPEQQQEPLWPSSRFNPSSSIRSSRACLGGGTEAALTPCTLPSLLRQSFHSHPPRVCHSRK